jgi:hypothetical protein
MWRLGRLACVAAVALAPACDRRMEPWVDPAREPPPTAQPVRVPGLDTPTPRAEASPPTARGAAPIRGSIDLTPSATVPAGSVLFVIARSAAGGPPLAVKRLAPGPFPMSFEIGPADVMIAGRAFQGPIELSARIDADGDPLTRSPQEPSAQATGALEPGASGVALVLAPPP